MSHRRCLEITEKSSAGTADQLLNILDLTAVTIVRNEENLRLEENLRILANHNFAGSRRRKNNAIAPGHHHLPSPVQTHPGSAAS